MATKAILVTAANVQELTNRFQHDGTGVMPAVGYYLVAQFGEDGDYDMVDSARFNAAFTRGEELRSGFFEAIRKDIPNG